MTNSSTLEQLITCLIQVIGRSAIPSDQVRAIVGDGRSNRKAFNLCDGTNTQMDIARKLKIDQGQLSRTCSRWVENGVAFWIGNGKEARLLHIYPVPGEERKSPRKRAKSGGRSATRR